MRGIFRGLPRTAGFCLGSSVVTFTFTVLLTVTGCSEDAKFINRDLGDASLDAESFIGGCPDVAGAQTSSSTALTCVAPLLAAISSMKRWLSP